MFYQIPATLSAELAELDSYIGQFKRGELDAATMKARRVPFGCYEQRQDGTYMVRVRTTGGALTPAQFKAIAETSARHGGSFIHVTTRQEFQIHDLALDDVTSVMRELLACGLSSRGGGGNTVRNIIVSPDAGTGLDEVFDPSPYAFALTSRLIAEADSWLLPRKLKFAFSNSPADTAYAQFNDVGYVARTENGVKGFRVFVAGGMGNKPEVGHLLHDFIPASDVYLVAEAVKRLFDKHGNRKNRHAARLRFLWKTAGEARFRELYEQEVDQLRLAGTPPLDIEAPQDAVTPPPLALETIDDPEFDLWKARFVEAQRQTGLVSVLVPIFLGNIKNEDVLKLAALLTPLGPQTIRATFGQNLRLRNIPENYLGTLWKALRNLGDTASPSRLIANATACTGANTCKLGICLPRGALSAIARRLAKSELAQDAIGDFRLNLSGCPNSCGQHMLADLGFFGNAARQDQRMYPAYVVVAGARLAEGDARLGHQIGRIAARDLPPFVEKALTLWLAKKPAWTSFADYFDGEGEQELRSLAETFADVPAFEDDKNYYYDWGADEAFSLVGRGIGECSAGLFDLIEVDLRKARQLLADSSADSERQDESLYQIALLSARALLITRGIEAETDASVFQKFNQHFIQAGLVDKKFETVITATARHDRAAVDNQRAEISALLAAVEALYQSMDNSLRFPAETTKPAAAPVPLKADVERDYRTVACPMNFVRVKLDLETMTSGQKLRVILGDGAPIRNVPRSVAEEGHKVLEQVQIGDVWSVLIEKS
ncbi:sulfurtransferase TusA family protein [Telmatospirillum sp.]|uniref:sulfurtransferase TusA family protein n=1 Tax=Telmatospirillum sp. TaxID=2079197 RepID=UPI00284EA7EE|nr:sulfurtransferase TusA family protein [Telmatospirillum sp.]MDR3437434.1 sulfurtransferase TusA family protein [Telmatospirillum sp.]